MADNLTTQSGTPATVPSATTIATDDIGGVHYQRVKLVDGTLDGTGAIGGDATNGLDVDVTRVQGTVAVSGPLTDTQLRATPVPISDGAGSITVDGTVAVSSVGGTIATTALTDTQLRATPVPVSGTFYQATQPVSGTVAVSSVGSTVTVTGALTDTQLRATAVPVSLSSTINTTQTPATSGGLSSFRCIWPANTFPSSPSNPVKSGAGQVFGWVITNTSASPRYVKFYEKTSNPTLASDTPKLTILVPGNTSGAGVVAAEFVNGIAFSTGIALAVTTVVTDTDTTAPSANEVIVNIFYK